MELQIPARNLKLFAKALACLAKIGPEMILEVADDGVKRANFSRLGARIPLTLRARSTCKR